MSNESFRPVEEAVMTTLSPASFLHHLATGVGSSLFLGAPERSRLLTAIDRCGGARDFAAVAPAVRDYSYYLARDFVRRIPGPVTTRLLGPQELEAPVSSLPAGGRGRPLPEAAPDHEFAIEVRCRTGDFARAPEELPTVLNWEISLRDLEEGFDGLGRLVAFGGFGPDARRAGDDRTMAFRMPSPGWVVDRIKERRPESAFDAAYAGGVVTFRDYDASMERREWPVGAPTARLCVDDEGEQHGVYFLYHDLGHGATRARRGRAVREAGHALLRAGLTVFPEIDGVSDAGPRERELGRFFTRLVELKTIYLVDQMAEAWAQCTAAYLGVWTLDVPPLRRYLDFVAAAESSLEALAARHPRTDVAPLRAEAERSRQAVRRTLHRLGTA